MTNIITVDFIIKKQGEAYTLAAKTKDAIKILKIISKGAKTYSCGINGLQVFLNYCEKHSLEYAIKS